MIINNQQRDEEKKDKQNVPAEVIKLPIKKKCLETET